MTTCPEGGGGSICERMATFFDSETDFAVEMLIVASGVRCRL
jgi:hypothetical protein